MALVIILLAANAVLLLFLSLANLSRRRLAQAGVEGFLGLTTAALAFGAGAILANLYTYQRLTFERPLARLTFQQLGPKYYRLYLDELGENRIRRYTLYGDEWQLDSRVLKWKGTAILAGLDAGIRLERISGRYQDITKERSGPRSVHRLSEDPGVDLWTLIQRYKKWLPWLDATYGSAAYLPMGDGAIYEVSAGQSGLIARPVSRRAEAAIRAWSR